MTIAAGDFVKWTKSGGIAKGKVVSVHTTSTVPNTSPRVLGTEQEPAARVQIHIKTEDGGFQATKNHTAVKVKHLTKIDALPAPKGSAFGYPPASNGGPMPSIGFASGMRSGSTEHRSTPVEVRDASVIEPDGSTRYQFWARVVGYDLEDTYGTDFRRGVFTEYLTSHTNRPTLCFGHGSSMAGIGSVLGHRVDWREDATGCDVLFALDDFESVPNAKQAWAQLMSGTFDSFSVGFIRRADEPAEDGGATTIVKADLPEVSIVIEPSNPGTGILAMSGQRSQPADKAADILVRYSQGVVDLPDALVEMRDVFASGDAGGGSGEGTPPPPSGEVEEFIIEDGDELNEERMAGYDDETREAITEWRAKYDAATLTKMLASGQAMKNAKGEPSFPIADPEDVKNAIQAVGLGGKSNDSIRKFIIARAKALNCENMIPDTWAPDGTIKARTAEDIERERLEQARHDQEDLEAVEALALVDELGR